MKHLPVISGDDAIRALTRAGFSFVRQKGSHVRMKKPLPDTTLNVTIPLHDELDRMTEVFASHLQDAMQQLWSRPL